MLQRIQTLFLLISVCVLSCMLFFPLATLNASDISYQLKIDSLINVTSNNQTELVVWPMFIMLVIMILVPFITIFFYKKRMYQIRLCIFSSILNLLFYGLFLYENNSIQKLMNIDTVQYHYIILLMPIISIVFNILAIRRIGQDEMLIRSLNSNRIR